MQFTPLSLSGAVAIEIDPRRDERGFFSRTFCEQEFAAQGLATHFPQSNISFNNRCGTVRGMHYQAEPYPEIKLVRCTRGAIYDVIIDLRPGSASFKQSLGIELNAENRTALYIPAGFAHGFQTLTDDTEVLYMMGDVYHADLARGVRWNDPAFNIQWPLPVSMISERDLAYPDFAA